ncbi:unnamed protein product [Lota lota]
MKALASSPRFHMGAEIGLSGARCALPSEETKKQPFYSHERSLAQNKPFMLTTVPSLRNAGAVEGRCHWEHD